MTVGIKEKKREVVMVYSLSQRWQDNPSFHEQTTSNSRKRYVVPVFILGINPVEILDSNIVSKILNFFHLRPFLYYIQKGKVMHEISFLFKYKQVMQYLCH
jgi:hypothetical protein